MPLSLRILIIAESDGEVAALLDTLRSHYSVRHVRVDQESTCQAELQGQWWDAVLCSFSAADSPAALRALRARQDGVDPPLLLVADAFEQVAEAAQRLGATVCLRQQGFAHLGPALERARQESERRSAQAKSVAFQAGQWAILEQIAAGRSLSDTLLEIVLLIERQSDGLLCSILLLDADGQRVRHGAAPHLPRALVESVDGAVIGPGEGSCGAAAYLRKPVVIADIGTHPSWANYRRHAIPFGLRACWSSPIVPEPGGGVLGTFAMYYREAREPTEAERHWVACATHLAAIAIQRDRAERAIRETDERYRQIVDTAYEGIWVIDSNARTLFTNDRTAKMLGYEPAELRGRCLVDFMDEASRRAVAGTFLERLRTASQQHESRFQRKDGSHFWALISGSPIRNDRGEALGALAMITDISELKQTEEALRQSEAEFRVLFENAAIGMALLAEDGRLVRSNPALQHWLGYSELELRALTFTDLAQAGSRGAELARQLLTFSRRQESRRRPAELVPLVAEALGLLRATLPKSIRIETHFDAGIPLISADPTQIHQIVMNLCSNAVHAMRDRVGTLGVSVQRTLLEHDVHVRSGVLRPGTYARLVVSDSGVGMDEATLERIFDPFFTSKPPGEGTGLGLSVVHGIVRNHEGGITVNSSPGHGAEFSIYFPALAAAAVSLEAARAPIAT